MRLQLFKAGPKQENARGRAAHFSASPAASPGEPVLDKDGHHDSLVEYDERGNQIAETFIDLDGKPLP